jgi:capsular polysaccharide biosynthesis protein
MAQSLPAIDWGLRTRRHPNVALALPPLLPWQEEALALLGYTNVPRLTLEPFGHYLLASAEYAEFLGDRAVRTVSRAASATYARLRQAVPPALDGGGEIYVARTDATNRVALNEDALIAMLERQGVCIVVPGSLPVTQQIAIFRRSRLVIGPHGAGLTNIIGCEPGTHLYELVPSHYPNVSFNRLAQGCGLHYWGDVFPSDAGEAGVHERTWRIDLDLVAARLDLIRAQVAAAEVVSG